MTSDASQAMTIAEVARQTGVSVHTLRFYERAGLLAAPVERSRSGWRRYRQQDLEWVEICTKLRSTGMPIRTLRQYAELVRSGPGNEAERLKLLEAHQAQVRAQLAELQENLELINFKVDVYRERLAAGQAVDLWSATR